ncbi:methylmalonyl-CoA mutase subunit beta [Algibacter sp. L1A34]|uniref:methylmalonyl-CoA mutase subunit beta n=1 Tax=Algibacter sp. L1A34 TaxID=2686365 RepID=UPI00131AD814|nr:methylmalonyl-CoA mutase subunit beta [Algibacter sp. L1A34]
MSKGLFDGFDPVSTKQWKQKIQFDLNGADFNDTLIWNSNEDIAVKPFYNTDDLKKNPTTSSISGSPWKIGQTIFVAHIENSNLKAVNAIKRGAERIHFIIPSEENISIESLLKNIDTSAIPIHFELQFLSVEFIEKILTLTGKRDITISVDIIGNLAKTGNWFKSLTDDFSKFETCFQSSKQININTSLYQNAGANIVQQLAYALAHANEYLNHLKIDTKQTIQTIFSISVGSNYFFEIAKIRALRLLWRTLATEYNINTDCHIIATPTKRNKTLYDYNTNILRTTTECMSAILGGANTVCNLPFDAIYHKDNEFGERIARNQLLILKHESYFDKVNNPADGAYYIESLTEQLAEKALDLFKNIERNGGFLNQLKSGTIQRKIKESADKEQQQFNSGERVLLGTNKHINPNDKMEHQLQLYPFVKINKRKTLIAPIIEKRLSEQVEQTRLKNEKQNEINR